MTFAYWCVLLALLLPIVWVGAAKTGVDNFDNDEPRVFMSKLTGWRARANWVQHNSYETFPPFAAGVIIAQLVGTDQQIIDVLAGIFVVSRITYGMMYVRNLSTLRSAVWTLGYFCIIGLFLAAGWIT
jgi:uncharacterized MAPEG superfamily protein